MYKTNEIVDKFLLTRVKIVSETHLRHPRCTYKTCRHFTKKRRTNTKIEGNRTFKIYL